MSSITTIGLRDLTALTLRSKLIDMAGSARSRSNVELARLISEGEVPMSRWQVERCLQHDLIPPATRSDGEQGYRR